MAKDDQMIMVIGRNSLFSQKKGPLFEGFCLQETFDYEQRILRHYAFMRRGDVEPNPAWKQPIAYGLIVNPNLQKFFVYQRSTKDEQYGEKRLQGKWSLGIGGHIERQDLANGNMIRDSFLRELREEVTFDGPKEISVLGYINDEADSIGQVHFGILYLVKTDAKEVFPNDEEIAKGCLKSLDEIENLFSQDGVKIEGWSKIAFNVLKSLKGKYF